jgi:hypothetical protein
MLIINPRFCQPVCNPYICIMLRLLTLLLLSFIVVLSPACRSKGGGSGSPGISRPNKGGGTGALLAAQAAELLEAANLETMAAALDNSQGDAKLAADLRR